MKKLLMALAMMMAVASTTRADDTDQVAKASYERGRQLASESKYTQAYDAFSAGYDASHRPVFLFNMAECARALDDAPRARNLYQQFLAVSPTGDLANTTRSRLAALGVTTPPPAPPVTTPAPPPAPTTPRTTTPPPAPTPTTTPAPTVARATTPAAPTTTPAPTVARTTTPATSPSPSLSPSTTTTAARPPTPPTVRTVPPPNPPPHPTTLSTGPSTTIQPPTNTTMTHTAPQLPPTVATTRTAPPPPPTTTSRISTTTPAAATTATATTTTAPNLQVAQLPPSSPAERSFGATGYVDAHPSQPIWRRTSFWVGVGVAVVVGTVAVIAASSHNDSCSGASCVDLR